MAELTIMQSINDEPGTGATVRNGERFASLSRMVRSHRRAVRAGRVQEAMTTSDFTFMADLIDRGLMVSYLDQAVPTSFDILGYRRDTADLARAGGKGRGRDYQINAARLIPKVAEKGEYLPIDPTDTYYEFKTFKYGCQWDLSWESWLADNRDLGMLRTYPESWGLSARYSMEYYFTQTYCANTTFFTADHGNINEAAGGALDIDSLGEGIAAIRNMADPAGNVLPYAGPLYLVVPPELELKAHALVTSSTVITGDTITMPASNPVQNSIAEVITNPFLPILDETYGTTGWYLFAEPRIRPAVRYGFLQGFDTPEIFVKAADAQRLLSGDQDPFDGSFLDDDIAFKFRFTFGADLVDYRGAYWSQGRAAS